MKTEHPEKKLQCTEERHSNPAVIWEQEMLHTLQAAARCPPGHTNAIGGPAFFESSIIYKPLVFSGSIWASFPLVSFTVGKADLPA